MEHKCWYVTWFKFCTRADFFFSLLLNERQEHRWDFGFEIDTMVEYSLHIRTLCSRMLRCHKNKALILPGANACVVSSRCIPPYLRTVLRMSNVTL